MKRLKVSSHFRMCSRICSVADAGSISRDREADCQCRIMSQLTSATGATMPRMKETASWVIGTSCQWC
jgi:hypothetical protein